MNNSSNAPLVSVIISIFNNSDTLEKAVNSILEQTLREIELILVDDGSSDSSLEILNDFANQDKRVRIIQNSENLGLASSLNKAIHMASAKYIARMDADDFAYPDRLKKQYDFLEKNTHISICGSFTKNVYESKDSELCSYYTEDDEIRVHLLFFSPFAHPTVMWNRQVFVDNDLYYDESFQKAQDYDLWERASSLIQMANVPEVLLDYSIRESSKKQDDYVSLQDRYAWKVRERQLKNMGIAISQKQKKMHESLCYRRHGDLFEQVDDVRNWLLKIYIANKSKRVVNQSLLGNYLLLKYYALIQDSPLSKSKRLIKFMGIFLLTSKEYYLCVVRILIKR